MKKRSSFTPAFLTFLDTSPTPFHAVQTMELRLQAQGFSQLNESDEWILQPEGRYYVVREDLLW